MTDIAEKNSPHASPATIEAPEAASLNSKQPTWPIAMSIGVVAAVVSVFCTMLYVDYASAEYNLDLKTMPYWLHQVRAGTFYVAGAIIALGFGLCENRRKRSIAPLMLAFGGLMCLAVAEVIALTLDLGVIGNVALRSLLLSLFLCKFLRISIPSVYLGLVIVLGTFAWLPLALVVGFTLSWSLIAAVQLKMIMTPPAVIVFAHESSTSSPRTVT